MVFFMSRLPDVNEPLTVKGFLTDPTRLFLSMLQRIIDSDIEMFYRVADFNNLSDISQVIKNPRNNMIVMVNDIGLARYKKSASMWVLAADDMTPIL